MSTKGTILLSNDNEHWYEELLDHSIVLEIDTKHLESYCESEGFVFSIKNDTELYKAICGDILRRKKPIGDKGGGGKKSESLPK